MKIHIIRHSLSNNKLILIICSTINQFDNKSILLTLLYQLDLRKRI